jgi:flagellar hook-associated protein FlgK
MAVIGTFGQFTTARLAIYASQASLSVTGNNIANINTTGYTRQRMDLVSLYSTGQGKYANIFNTNVGYGVLTRGATQLRDPYLDIRYRNENSKLGANDEKLNSLLQIGNILDEVGKGEDGFGVIEAQFEKFMEALQNNNTNIGSEEYDKLVRSAASILTTYFNKAADDLADIKENKVNELKESVSDVNKLLTEIRDLNVQIRTQNIYGDKALELRDARNLALDKLSGYMNIEVTYSMERIDQFSEVEKLTVSIAGSKGPDGKPIKLVDGIYGGQIEMPEKMPVLNEKANQQAILDAMQAARDAAMKLTDDEVKQRAPAGWDAGLADAIQKAQEKAVKKVLDKYGLATEADANNIADPTEKANALAEIAQAKKDGEKKATDSVLNNLREKFAEEDAAAAKVTATQQSGKYLLENGDATDDLELALANPNAQFNFDPKDPTKADSLYLMQLGKLVDQQGRVMEEKGNPSGKSEIIAFTDTTFCGSYTNPDGTVHATTALGSIQAIREMLTREGEYCSQEDLDRDANANIKRGIPYYERALDNLAKEFAKVFNEMNQISLDVVYDMNTPPVGKDGKPILDADGNQVTVAWADITEVVENSKGEKVTVFKQQPETEEQAALIDLVRSQAVKAPGYSFYDGGVLLSNRGDNNDPTGITAANISISDAWGNHTVRMLQTKQKSEVKEDGTEVSHTTERDNIIDMIAEFTKKRDFIAKDVQDDAHAILPVFHGSFQEVFTAISGVLGDDAQATNGKAENYALSTLDLENSRQSISGVDLNDEATSMMQFSKSYSAACRLLTTIDSMLDTLINGTAR